MNKKSCLQVASLDDLGWNAFFQESFKKLAIPGSIPARTISESRGSFQVYSRFGELYTQVSGKLQHTTEGRDQYPAVGDWVVLKPLIGEQKGIIQAVLPRKSKFSRKVAGERTEEQIICANIDTVFLVSGLDGGRNFNLRRIERYLTLAWSSGATPVIVLNKVDLCQDAAPYIRAVESIAPGIYIHPVSVKQNLGLAALKTYLTKGHTAVFLGSSGVGKSSLINALLSAEKQETGDVRKDDRMGRHTTTKRELIVLPDGGMVIDTPGMREISLWAEEDDLQGTFFDIEKLAESCRFKDCGHNSETGCAVKASICRGELDPARLESFHKQQSELSYLTSREEHSTRLYEKIKWKKIAKWSKELNNRPDTFK